MNNDLSSTAVPDRLGSTETERGRDVFTTGGPGVSATFEEPAAPQPHSEPRFDIRVFLLRRLMRFGMFCVWYVLSIGPMFWIWHHAHLSNQPSLIDTFYMPLAVACQVLPWFRDLVNTYINWWIL